MPRPGHDGSSRERREKKEQFQSFNKPKLKVARTAADEQYKSADDLLAWGTPTGIETVTSEAAVISVMGAMAAVALVPFALRGRGRLDSATFVIVASALAYGAANIATKLVSDGVGDGAWILVAVWLAVTAAIGVIGLTTEMTALQRRPATFVVPVSFAIQTFLPIAFEPIYLTERWGSAAVDGIPLIVGLALVALGAIAVARTRAVSALAVG